MVISQAAFNPSQYEERGYTNPYLSPEQQNLTQEVEGRVNSQLNWLAQSLGWSGDEYWFNLVNSVADKRRLLAGSFGVYDKYIYPKVVCIRNWDISEEISSPQDLALNIINSQNKAWVVLKKDLRIKEGQIIVVGDVRAEINTIKEVDDTYEILITDVGSALLSAYESGSQIKVEAPQVRPAPFYRPQVQTSGDTSFLCGVNGTELLLFPTYDTGKNLAYKFNSLIVGSKYSFDKPVYLSKSESRVIDGDLVDYPRDLLPSYDPESQLWYFIVPDDYSLNEFGTKAYLVWLYSDETDESFCVKEVNLQRWYDPSDWDQQNVLEYYLGAWGNKGGVLPYNFVFDSLEISGFDEQKSMLLEPLENRVGFDTLLNFVYYQETPIDVTYPGTTKENEVWWDSDSGVFSVWKSGPYGCGNWEEIFYPDAPVVQDVPQYVYPTVEDFEFSQATVEPYILVEIEDASGLSPLNDIIGLLGSIVSPCSLTVYKDEEGYWVPTQFTYADELDFDADALVLPWNTKVLVQNAINLGAPRVNYSIENLKIVITESLPVDLLKINSNSTWLIRPTSSLKYIGKTRLFASNPNPVQGAMNWSFEEEDEENRRAAIFYYSSFVETSPGNWELAGAWIDVNTGEAVDPPEADLDFGTVLVYCNDTLLEEGQDAGYENFSFIYEIDSLTGEFVFKYAPNNFSGVANLPIITISDSLTSVFRFDISEYVFSGISYYMSPNVLDAETPLRIWKTEDLQAKGLAPYEGEMNYRNPLIADQNNGPGNEDWSKYHLRLPPRYGRNGPTWQRVALVCEDFGYWGSPVSLTMTDCPSEDRAPRIYEQVVLFNEDPSTPTTLYTEPYLYSDIFFGETPSLEDFSNSGVLPAKDAPFDEFVESFISSYEPLHNRRANTDLAVGGGYGNWEGIYARAANCAELSGYVSRDLVLENLQTIDAPLWDASIYKLPISCEVDEDSYAVDMNNFKIEYAYFAADLSCAEDTFYDIHQEACWRQPVNRPRTLYMTPQG